MVPKRKKLEAMSSEVWSNYGAVPTLLRKYFVLLSWFNFVFFVCLSAWLFFHKMAVAVASPLRHADITWPRERVSWPLSSGCRRLCVYFCDLGASNQVNSGLYRLSSTITASFSASESRCVGWRTFPSTETGVWVTAVVDQLQRGGSVIQRDNRSFFPLKTSASGFVWRLAGLWSPKSGFPVLIWPGNHGNWGSGFKTLQFLFLVRHFRFGALNGWFKAEASNCSSSWATMVTMVTVKGKVISLLSQPATSTDFLLVPEKKMNFSFSFFFFSSFLTI